MSVECGECEWVVYAGHAPTCSRRCQVVSPAHGKQCDRSAGHPDLHELYDEDGDHVIAQWSDTVETVVVVWSKPACVQCGLVKQRLTDADVPFVERDLTAPEAAKDLAHFKGLGYASAPITEYGGIAFPGFMPSEVDRVIDAWRAAHPEEVQS